MGVRGSIVCTASVVASRGYTRSIGYCMSKHAVLGLVRSASARLGVHGIRVNSVSPYAVATPGVCSSLGREVEEVKKIYEAYTSLKGIVLKGKHIGDAVLFLASEDSEFVTGHDLMVDGGFFTRMS
ncbi:short-chain dehydrogenase reductase 3b-like [Pistacia vera]|uniref:short-chain dehydrogenase reductase 3b-like n=1 Tax=Pistacia vera TaxID=55513 RepID=UPI0012638BBB|nr:short-chain dehydrogenase reductase 3b-like [Pistacia vera]